MTWEIKRIEVPTGMGGADQAERLMAEACADGWELVAVVGQGSTHWLYFKREASAANSLVPAMAGQITRVPAKKKAKTDG